MIFQNIIRDSLGEKEWIWFWNAIQKILNSFDEKEFIEDFALAGKYLKAKAVMKDAGDLPRNIVQATLAEIGRVEMLLSLASISPSFLAEFVHRLYSMGDNKEQIAILKALPLLPDPQSFLPVALEAHRSNVTTVFSALACDNPFPADFMEEFHFNNLVLKALFVGLSLACIHNLEKRLNPKMAQMVQDWILEREAAHRPINPEVWMVVVPFAKDAWLEKVYHYLSHPQPEHRYWAALSLGKTREEKHLPYLEKQESEEKDAL